MTLSPENLVGYVRAEFAKASNLRVWLFFVQLAVAVPGAASVVADDKLILYVLAIAGAVLAVAWWVLNSLYTAARDAAQSARRATLLVAGLDRPLSAHALLALKEKLTVTEEKARKNENPNYYATRNPAGPGRLAEMIEESAFYSGKLQTISANVMLGVILLFAVIFACIAIFAAPVVARDTAMTGLRVFLAILVFVMSSDVLGAYRLHKSAAKAINEVRMRLVTAEGQDYPEADVLLAMVDYNAAVESAPESVPYAYKFSEKKLNKLWTEYKVDREAARQEG
ncbi:hypothetical protein ACFFJ7_17495 [Pseudochelatococcus lubricantis]